MSLGPEGYPPAPADPPVRFLDPSQVRRRPNERSVGSTWYVADRLLVHGDIPGHVRNRLARPRRVDGRAVVLPLTRPGDDAQATKLEREAWRQGCSVAFEARVRAPQDTTGADEPAEVDEDYGFVLRLVPERPGTEPDAWGALEADAEDEGTSWRLSLDHVMTATPFTGHPFTGHPFTGHPFTGHPFTGHPFTGHPFTGHPFTGHPIAGMAEYAVPGSGGRAPVRWVGPDPQRGTGADVWHTADGIHRPVVAVVDTGVGTHRWFGTYPATRATTPSDAVVHDATLPDGRPVGTYPVGRPAEDAEGEGTSVSPLTGPLDPLAGHGTFIAGIVHQLCPEAVILPVRAMGGSGAAIESEVIESLRRLYRYHRLGLASAGAREGLERAPVDVVVLAMGYYHEQPEDLETDHPLREVLDRLRASGVAVVIAAGNDGETRPEYPAAFAPPAVRWRDAGGRRGATFLDGADDATVPLVTVGATNPDGSTALFSNDGAWVTCLRPGAAVVSSVPQTLYGPATPSVRLKGRFPHEVRATIDPEGFEGGFATWSGTSFAAPYLAAEIAREILAQRSPGGADHDAGPAPVTRATVVPSEHSGSTGPSSEEVRRHADGAPADPADRVADTWNALRRAVPLSDGVPV